MVIILEQKEKEVRLSFRDTGIGIPKDDLPRLFTKFFRARNVLRAQIEGHGLGLYLVRNIVRGHGGDMWVSSRENEGSTFTFSLPIASAPNITAQSILGA